MAQRSRICRCDYWIPGPHGKQQRILCSEYWLPEAEVLNSDRLRREIEIRTEEEIRRYYEEIATPDMPVFDRRRIRLQWIGYDWDAGRFNGAPRGVPHPDEIMRPPDDGAPPGGAGDRVPRRPVPGSLTGGAEAIPPEEPSREA